MVEEQNPLLVDTEKWMLPNEAIQTTIRATPHLLAPIRVNSPRELLTNISNTLIRRGETQKETQNRKMKNITRKVILLTPVDSELVEEATQAAIHRQPFQI